MFFTNLPDSLILDDSTSTSLDKEFLLNKDKQLEICKIFNVSGAGAVSEEAYIVCDYPDNPELEKLLSMKRTALKNQFKELNIDPAGVNKNKSNELRDAIRNHYYQDGVIQTLERKIKIDGKIDNEDNLKKIWSSLKNISPCIPFFLLISH